MSTVANKIRYYKRNQARNSRPDAMLRRFPKTRDTTVRLVHTFRFVNSQTESKAADYVTSNSLADLMFFATGATTANALFSSVRLKRVELYGIPNPNGFTGILLEWVGKNTPNKVVEAVGDNVAPPKISMAPPRDSLASFWICPTQSGTSNPVVFSLSAPAGSFCDVTLECIVCDQDPEISQYALTTSGATAGLMYFNPLDNTTVSLAGALGVWQPQGVSTMRQAWG
jgi:hypothetical protein